ncbi:MAG: tRNA-dihydrouridine synthase, partial [Oscillospiraceae bacterium]
VVGNGDIFTADDAKEMFEETGCDMVMVGRGALGNPWIFAQIKALLTNNERLADPTIEERLAVLREEIALLIADKGNDIGYREARKHVAWYMSGLRGAAALRRMCGAICGPADIENICGVVMAENGGQPKN